MLLLTMTSGKAVILYLECSYISGVFIHTNFLKIEKNITLILKLGMAEKKEQSDPKKTHIRLQKFNLKCN